jgi:hypothetical protein
MLASSATLSSPPQSGAPSSGSASATSSDASSAQVSTDHAGRSKARMRWADSPKVLTPLPTQTTFRTAAASTQSSVKRGEMLTLAATLEKFNKLQRRLERYDKRDLADFGSALRVRHQKSRLTTTELMRLPGQLHRLIRDVAGAAADLRARSAHSAELPGAGHLQCYDEATALLSRLQHLDPQRAPHSCEVDDAPLGASLHTPARPLWRPTAMDGHAFIASLRAKTPPPPVKQNYAACKAIVNQIDQELALLNRAEGVVSAQLQSLLEEDDLAGALAATAKELNLHICSGLVGKTGIAPVSKAIERLTGLKKKLDAVKPWDVSPAAKKLRLKGRDENIRCRNLLGALPRLPQPNPILCVPAEQALAPPRLVTATGPATGAGVIQSVHNKPESTWIIAPEKERVRLVNPFFRNPLYIDDGYDIEKSPVERSPAFIPIATIFEASDEYETGNGEHAGEPPGFDTGVFSAILVANAAASAAHAASEAALPLWARDKQLTGKLSTDKQLITRWKPPRHDISIPASWTAPQTCLGKLARGPNIVWKITT